MGAEIIKNYWNKSPPKEYSKSPLTGPKEMEIQEWSDKEFKIIVLHIPKKAQINNNNISKTIQDQNEKFNKDIENIKKKTNFGGKEYND